MVSLSGRRSTPKRGDFLGSEESSRSRALADFVLRVRAFGAPWSDEDRLAASFFVDPQYWQRNDAQDRAITGAYAYWQRLTVQYGLNLYCAACRQIALAATGEEEAIRAADRHSRMLLDDRAAGSTMPLRGWSDHSGNWRYGDERCSLSSTEGSAYFFSAICDRFLLTDPLTGATHLPEDLGGAALSWNLYDPFLGENSWAALIAPLQVEWLKARGGPIAADADGIRLALSLVPACKAMQSPVGGIYARPAPGGHRQEQLISNETNLTLYAGLTMLKLIIEGVPALAARSAEVDSLRHGLMRYFRQHLFGHVDGECRFHACAAFVDGAFRPGLTADGQPARFAADVHTWGLSILGVDEVESRYGPGTCWQLWETVKRRAGYFPGSGTRLGGIGFSSGPQDASIHDVCSPEWTFGAINMCRILAAQYDRPGAHRNVELAARLREDEQSMLEGVRAFETIPDTPFASLAYLYVNRVTDTGFGWNALPLPSLCATAWALMIRNHFNPFQLGGGSDGVRSLSLSTDVEAL